MRTTDNFSLRETREAKLRPRAGSEAPILRVRPTTLPTDGCAPNIRSEGKAPPIGNTYCGVRTRPSNKVGPFRSDCSLRPLRNSYVKTTGEDKSFVIMSLSTYSDIKGMPDQHADHFGITATIIVETPLFSSRESA